MTLKLVWGSSAILKQRSGTAEKKAIRAINKLTYNSHTENYFIYSRLFKIHELSRLLLGAHMYNLLSNAKLSFDSDYQNNGTTNQNCLKIPKFN